MQHRRHTQPVDSRHPRIHALTQPRNPRTQTFHTIQQTRVEWEHFYYARALRSNFSEQMSSVEAFDLFLF